LILHNVWFSVMQSHIRYPLSFLENSE